MKNHIYLAIFTTLAVLCFLIMLTATGIWMNVPTRIIHHESSLGWTESHSIEVKQHGHAYFITPDQKLTLDRVRFYTPIVWFSCFAYLFLFTAFGGFERLRLLGRQNRGVDGQL
jgi:hypothetical protein